MTVHPPGEAGIESGPERGLRLLNKARTASVALTGRSLAAEVTEYDGWDSFKPSFLRAIETVAESAAIVGVERVGLRYINEIRVPQEISDPSTWKGWINDDLLGFLDPIPGYTPESFQAVTALTGDRGHMVVRLAALDGEGVVSNQPLRRPTQPVDGPFFVVDTDSYCDTPGEQMLEFTSDSLEPVLDELHEPIGALFQRTITDKLRDVFRGRT